MIKKIDFVGAYDLCQDDYTPKRVSTARIRPPQKKSKFVL